MVVRDGDRAIGRPVAHVEMVGDHPRTGPELPEQLGPQLEIHRLEEVEGHDGGGAQVHLEEVALDEADPVLDARPAGVAPGDRDQGVLELDPHARHSVAGGGQDRDPSVAGSEVEEGVPVGGPRELEHRLHHRNGRHHEGHVRKAGRLVRLLGGEGPGRRGRQGRGPEERRDGRPRPAHASAPRPYPPHRGTYVNSSPSRRGVDSGRTRWPVVRS